MHNPSISQDLQLLREGRRKLIDSKVLTVEQADKLFEAFWKSNIKNTLPTTDLRNRDPSKIFVTSITEDGAVYMYGIEIEHFFKLMPLISPKESVKIRDLFDSLPFWIDHYKSIEEVMFRFDSKKVLEDWKKLIIEEEKLGKPKTWTGGYGSSWLLKSRGDGMFMRLTEDELVRGLIRLSQLNDKEFLISLINHYSEKVRLVVQALLKGENPVIEPKKSGRNR